MDMLIDLVCIRDASEDPQEKHMYTHGSVRSVSPTYNEHFDAHKCVRSSRLLVKAEALALQLMRG